MKIKLHPYLHKLLSKHFISNHLPKLIFALEPSDLTKERKKGQFIVNKQSFKKYWIEKLSVQHRKQALYFFMPELIELVNKTNSRLLYSDLVQSISLQKENSDKPLEEQNENEYHLLNVFEMLWNVDKSKSSDANNINYCTGSSSSMLD
jgi:hypothetical protein